MIGALALLVPAGPTGAQQGRKSQVKVQQQSTKKKAQQQKVEQPRAQQPKQKAAARQARLPQEQLRQRVQVEQRRETQYREHLREHDKVARQRAQTLKQQNRNAHYRYQQHYDQRLYQQRRQFAPRPVYNFYYDPYVYTAPSYRYLRGGMYYTTNRYGADLLRRAVNYGYAEGYRAGQADRYDRWRYGYEDSYAYLDATYGYPGYYVDLTEYNYYFREGFRHGYEDGYYGRYRYGRRSGATWVILASVLAGIVVLEAIDDD